MMTGVQNLREIKERTHSPKHSSINKSKSHTMSDKPKDDCSSDDNITTNLLIWCKVTSPIASFCTLHKLDPKKLEKLVHDLRHGRKWLDKKSNNRYQTNKAGLNHLNQLQQKQNQLLKHQEKMILDKRLDAVVEETKQMWEEQVAKFNDYQKQEKKEEVGDSTQKKWYAQIRTEDGDTSIQSSWRDNESKLNDILLTAIELDKSKDLCKLSILVGDDIELRLRPKNIEDGWSEQSERKLKSKHKVYSTTTDTNKLFFVQQDILCDYELLMHPSYQIIQHYLLRWERHYLSSKDIDQLLKLKNSSGEEFHFFHEMAKNLNVIKAIWTVEELQSHLKTITKQ
jgi:hypothetical protein